MAAVIPEELLVIRAKTEPASRFVQKRATLPYHAQPRQTQPRPSQPGRALPCHARPHHAQPGLAPPGHAAPGHALCVPVQPFGCETAVLWAPITQANLRAGNCHPAVNLADVEQCVLDIQRDDSRPLWKLGAHPHYASLPYPDLGGEAETLISPQFICLAWTIIHQFGVLQAEATRLCQRAFFHLHCRPDRHAIKHGVGDDGAVRAHVEAGQKLNPRHLFKVGVGLLSFARDRLQQFGPLVQRVGSLTVVLEQRGDRCQLVVQGLPSHV